MSGIEWLWKGYIARGLVTLLQGRGKVGKTTLLEGLLRAMAQGEDFLEQPTSGDTAVIVTEEPALIWAVREASFGPAPKWTLIDRTKGSRSSSTSWKDKVQLAVDAAREGDHRLIVFDSLTALSGLIGTELENDAGAVLERTSVLMERVGDEPDLAILITHHLNQRGYARGSTAFEQEPDIIAQLLRGKANTSFRILGEMSRLPTTPATLRGDLIQEFPWSYKLLGAGTYGNQEAVWDALERVNGDGVTSEELVEMAVASRGRVDQLTKKWIREGKIQRLGSGKRGDPYRFRRVDAATNGSQEIEGNAS